MFEGAQEGSLPQAEKAKLRDAFTQWARRGAKLSVTGEAFKARVPAFRGCWAVPYSVRFSDGGGYSSTVYVARFGPSRRWAIAGGV